jgi:HSP20 family protein
MTLVKVNNPVSKSLDSLMNEFLNELPVNFGKSVREDFLAYPPVNIQENDAAYLLQLAIPGFEKTDFSIKQENNLLTISATKKDVVKDETVKMIRTEFTQKAFKRSFTIDEKIDSANIAAKYENGILLIELPKKEKEKAAAKEINIL